MANAVYSGPLYSALGLSGSGTTFDYAPGFTAVVKYISIKDPAAVPFGYSVELRRLYNDARVWSAEGFVASPGFALSVNSGDLHIPDLSRNQQELTGFYFWVDDSNDALDIECSGFLLSGQSPVTQYVTN